MHRAACDGMTHGYPCRASISRAIRLSGMFFREADTGPVSAAKYARIQRYIRTRSVRTLERLRDFPIEQTIADVNVRSHTFRFITPAMTGGVPTPAMSGAMPSL